jgi:3-oxoadipate enol-lactonase
VAEVEVNGARLWYEVEGDGPTVMLVHEAIGDSDLWDDLFPALVPRYRTLRYDLRGFGRSTLPPGPYAHVDDLRGILDAAQIERTALVGGSLGARVALELAVVAPERVTALALLAPGFDTWEWSEEVRRFGQAEDEAIDRGDIDAAVELNLDLWVAGPGRPLADIDQDVVSRVREMQRRAFEIQVPAYEREPKPSSNPLPGGPIAERLGEIRAPTLVVVGTEDVDDMHRIADRVVEAVPGARKAIIEDAAHAANVERPEQFNRLVLEFLADIL